MYSKAKLVDQACGMFGVKHVPFGDHCFVIPTRGVVEYIPERAYKRWDAERIDDNGDTVIRQYDHAYEAVRSVAS